jgi:glucose-6-phosphate-specific signal transduction histidine kinase
MENLYSLMMFLLISIGISCIWSLSDIFLKNRNFVAKKFPSFLRKMLLCMECSSFWIGCLVCVLICSPEIIKNSIFNIPFVDIFCGGVITHLFVKILNNFNVFEGKNNL